MIVLWRKTKPVGKMATGVSACERTEEGELFRVAREDSQVRDIEQKPERGKGKSHVASWRGALGRGDRVGTGHFEGSTRKPG